MEASGLKKRMGRISRDFHRRMDNDPRLDGIMAKLDGIENTLGDIKRDFLVASSEGAASSAPSSEAPKAPKKSNKK